MDQSCYIGCGVGRKGGPNAWCNASDAGVGWLRAQPCKTVPSVDNLFQARSCGGLGPGGRHRGAHLVEHAVAAGDVVLGDLVDGGVAREVVAHEVAGLHGDNVLELHQGALGVKHRVAQYVDTLPRSHFCDDPLHVLKASPGGTILAGSF